MNIFERTEMLLGTASVEKLSRCHVAAFGVGGVGGHLIEALVRSGLGEITLVDPDTVAPSNINRQIIALHSTLGMYKTEAMAARIRDINPDCVVHEKREFFLPENSSSFDFGSFDYVADAIDTVSGKIEIAKICDSLGVSAIAAMGAGNKTDPTMFEVSDIFKTSFCPLAAVMRRELRKAGVRSLKVVYSREPALTPAFQPTPDAENKIVPSSSAAENTENMEKNATVEVSVPKRRIVPASSAFVPAVCGLIMAGEIIRDLCRNEFAERLSENSKK